MVKMLIIGHLGKDADVNNVNGKNVINFNVAHTDKYKDNQGTNIEKTTWVSCSYWTDKTGIAPYLKKGTQVYVEGFPDARAYTNNTGQAQASLNMRVQSIQLLGSAKAGQNGSAASPDAGGGSTQGHAISNPAEITEPIDDLPF